MSEATTQSVPDDAPFVPRALLHRHGGRITSLRRIEHATHDGRATWFFVGTVEWFEGMSSGEELEISPTAVVIEGEQGKAECDVVMEALSDYLIEHGQWCEQGRWKPRLPFGSASLCGRIADPALA